MHKIGIICEYNPFHNGHLFHLNCIKEKYPDSIIVLVISGEFTERGDLSLLNKWDKTKIALNHGINLVVELPFCYATQSADLFAYGALAILNKLNVDTIVFGSESNDIELLTKLAKTQLTDNYNKTVVLNLKQGNSYAKATANSLDEELMNKPNDILGISYIREIIKNNYPIEPICIKRTNDYNDINLTGSISSATSIRESIFNNIDIKKYVPYDTYNLINKINLDEYYDLLKYRILNEQEEIIKYNGIDIKIRPRILNSINKSNNFNELILNIKAKNYSYNRIKRMLIHILIGFKKDDFCDKSLKYIRLLGFDNIGKQYLNSIKKDISIPLITNYHSDSNNNLNINTKIINVLSIKHKEYLKEFSEKLIIKD